MLLIQGKGEDVRFLAGSGKKGGRALPKKE